MGQESSSRWRLLSQFQGRFWSALPQNGYAEDYTMLYEPDFAELDSTFLLARRISTSFISWEKKCKIESKIKVS